MAGRVPTPATYVADWKRLPRKVIDGEIKHRASVTVVRYDKPTGKPVTAAKAVVSALTGYGLKRRAEEMGRDLITQDKERRKREKRDLIERLTESNKVNLRKE